MKTPHFLSLQSLGLRGFESVYGQLYWQRYMLMGLGWLTGPWRRSPHLHIEDTHIAGVPVRVYVPKTRTTEWNKHNDGAIIFVHGGGFALGEVGKSIFD